MKFYVLILLTALLMSVACSNSNRQAGNEVIQKTVVLDENLRRNENGEIVIDVNRLEKNENSAVAAAPNQPEISVTLNDSSQISTMFDGYGNRTDTRVFYKDALVSRLIIRSAATGNKKVFLYANNGDVYILPENMNEIALSASADELRKSVNLNEIRDSPESDPSSQKFENPNSNEFTDDAAKNAELKSKTADAETRASDKQRQIIDEKTVTAIQPAPVQPSFISEILNDGQLRVKIAAGTRKNKDQ